MPLLSCTITHYDHQFFLCTQQFSFTKHPKVMNNLSFSSPSSLSLSDDYDDIYLPLVAMTVTLMGQECEDSNVINRTRTSIYNREREALYTLLVCDYFVDDCLYNNIEFKRHFRNNRRLFMHIANNLEANYKYF